MCHACCCSKVSRAYYLNNRFMIFEDDAQFDFDFIERWNSHYAHYLPKDTGVAYVVDCQA